MKKIPGFVKNKYFVTSLAFSIYFLFLDDLDIITIINQKRKLSKLEAQRELLAYNLTIICLSLTSDISQRFFSLPQKNVCLV